jgi:hypothetical protein
MRMHSLNWWMHFKQSNIILRHKRSYSSLLSNFFVCFHLNLMSILIQNSLLWSTTCWEWRNLGWIVHQSWQTDLKKYFGSYFELRKIGASRYIELIDLYWNGCLDESVHLFLFEDSCKDCGSKREWTRTRSNKTTYFS